METTYQIDVETMKKIRLEIVKFHLDQNKRFFKIIKIMMLFALVFVFFIDLFYGFDWDFFILLGVTIMLNVFLDERIQIKLGIKNIDKAFKKFEINQFMVLLDINRDLITIETDLIKQVVKRTIQFSDIYVSKYIVSLDVMIFSRGKIISNYMKSRPYYISLSTLSNDEKETLINLFKLNSHKYIIK